MMATPSLQFAGLNTTRRILIIAEIGNNHEGRISTARDLVHRAAECGVDGVKFQTFRTDHYVSRTDAARHARLKSFELSFEQFTELAELARGLGLAFLSTPFDLESARFLAGVVDCFKIASGDNNFFPLLELVARTGKPVIVSTGASDMPLVRRAAEFLRDLIGANLYASRVAFLHAVSAYPAPPAEVNLRAIETLRVLGCVVGYSDHTLGIDAAILAVALGARVIEKHFTLDHQFSDFRDHQLAADPDEMRLCVRRIREAEQLLGDGAKRVQPSEQASASAIRRSVVSGRDLPAGHVIALADLTWLRPAGGISPGEEAMLVGKMLRRSVSFGEQLRETDVE